MKLLSHTGHRTWPLPRGPWIMEQVWHELLFAHWPIAHEIIQNLLPGGLQVDTYNNQAWIAVVPFRMSGIRARFLPPLPGLSAFPELNVRTYVTIDDKPGVYFFSLEATNPVAVRVARKIFNLPYMDARMSIEKKDEKYHYSSFRTHKNENPAEFLGTYKPLSPVFKSEPGSIEHWLTERYCLYSVDPENNVYRGNIHHQQWPLQIAEATIEKNTMASCHGIEIPDTKPLLHYSDKLEVVVWFPEFLGKLK
jgi:uncharacterized protein YqjF (DUF2071 family)